MADEPFAHHKLPHFVVTSRRWRCIMIVTLIIVMLLTVSLAQSLVRLPDHLVTYDGSVIMIPFADGHLTYIEGLGWLATDLADLPEVRDDGVYVSESFMALMQGNEKSGEPSNTSTLESMPAPPTSSPEISVLPPPEVPDLGEQNPARDRSFNFFANFPFSPAREITRVLQPGVIYQKFFRTTPHGESTIHLLEVAPERGHFRVVGASQTPAKTSDLASGGLAAINAGYFDTSNFAAIGFLKVDYGLQSLPSRNRASIGFGTGAPVIDRVQTHVQLHVNGQIYTASTAEQDSDIVVNQASGQLAGNPRQGVLIVDAAQRVISNTIGPRRIPQGGFAVVYAPDIRPLALVTAGERLRLEVVMRPEVFQGMRYAVEAGPLLLRDGRVAYQPELEAFSRGTPIIDSVTQQAAIGVKADGTTLLVTSNRMTAADLIPLFIALGAEHAMRLDSGSSSTLVVEGEVVNRSFERRVVTAIVFIPDQQLGQQP